MNKEENLDISESFYYGLEHEKRDCSYCGLAISKVEAESHCHGQCLEQATDIAVAYDLEYSLTNLSKALKNNAEFFYVWQSNIAMAVVDALIGRKTYKKGASLNRDDFHKAANHGAKKFLMMMVDAVTEVEGDGRGNKVPDIRTDAPEPGEENSDVDGICEEFPELIGED